MAWFKCGGGGIPAILKSLMNSVFNKKFGTAETYAPEIWPDTVNLMGPLEEKTASGAVVSFSDGADDVPIKSANFGIVSSGGGGTPSAPVPIVGKSSVTVYQTGKNLCGGSQLLENAQAYITSGSTDTTNKTFSFGYNATLTADIGDFVGSLYDKFKENTQYTFIISASRTGTSSRHTNIRIRYTDGTYTNVTFPENFEANTKYTIVVTSTADKTVKSLYYSSINYTTTTLYYEESGIFEGTLTAEEFEAYKAKTPITIQLGQTVYGGTLDSDGTLTLTHGSIKWKNLTDTTFNASKVFYGDCEDAKLFETSGTPTGGILSECSTFFPNTTSLNYMNSTAQVGYSGAIAGTKTRFAIKTNYANKTEAVNAIGDSLIVYPLETPIVITGLDEISMSTYLGDNTIWCDSGDSEITYRSSGTQTLIPPTLISKTITANDTYSASDDNADGYSSVTVNVPTGTTEPFKVLSINGTAGTETFTADHAGTYMFLVGTSAQGTATITSAVTPDLTFSKQSSDNRGLVGAIYTLGVGDTVTMSNTVISWVYNTKVVVEMNISVSAVIDSAIVNDGTLPSFTPSISGNTLFISMAGGRSNDNSYDRTYTDLNSFEFFGKVETGIFLRIRYGSTVPNYQLYGYDGGCALAIALSVNAPSLLMSGLGNPGPVNEPEEEELDAAPEDPEEIQEETPEEVDQNESNDE